MVKCYDAGARPAGAALKTLAGLSATAWLPLAKRRRRRVTILHSDVAGVSPGRRTVVAETTYNYWILLRSRVNNKRETGMDVNRPEHYYRAALERIKQAHYLYREGSSYSLAMYVAGVAVECLLRAFRARKNPEFESRHDLLSLFAESGMLKVAQEKLRAGGWSAEEIASHVKTMRAAVNDVYILWHNNYRYASENRVLTHLKRIKLYRGVTGDLLKAKALQLYNAANLFIAKRVLQWH